LCAEKKIVRIAAVGIATAPETGSESTHPLIGSGGSLN